MAYFRCGGQGASGDAVAADVLLNKTFSNDDDTDVVGTMPNNGKVTPSGLNCGGSYTIPAGYHNGQGVVTANSLASQTGVDSGKTAVGAAQMLTGYQGWANGSKITGTMPNKGAWTPSNINPGGSVTIPAGYHNGSGKVTANANQNSGTKTITSSDANWLTGNVDMGANNTYRYVNAVNVYNKGKEDGSANNAREITLANPFPATKGRIYIVLEYSQSTQITGGTKLYGSTNIGGSYMIVIKATSNSISCNSGYITKIIELY